MDLYDRPAANELLASRNDVMTVYREFENSEGRLFPLRYVRAGYQSELPTIMVLPDGPGVASVFPYEILRRDMVKKGLDVIMMEHRGVGMSRADAQGNDLPVGVMSVENVLDDVRAVLDHAQVPRVVLYGTGYGAYIAQRFALRHPERVFSMVLDSPFTGVRDGRALRELMRDLYWRGTFDATESIARAVRMLVEQRVVPVDETGVVLAAVHEYGGVNSVRDLVDLLVQGRGQLAWASIHQIIAGREWFNTTPYVYENDLAGRISATELGFAEASDGKPLDPLTVYARRAAQFPPFAGESFDLETARRSITTPTLVVGGARDVIVPLWRSRLAADEIPGAHVGSDPSNPRLRFISAHNVGHALIDSHIELSVVAMRWAAAGAIDALLDRDISSLNRSVRNEAYGRGIRTALLAEQYSPLKLWSVRSLAAGPLASADARGPRGLTRR